MRSDVDPYEVAFVLGGGGILGAHEVGMLRALAESSIEPDVILGTSIGAINGAMFAADPTVEGVDRIGRLWDGSNIAGMSAGALVRRVTTLARTGTHLQSLEEARLRLADALPVERVEELKVPFQCVAASIERAAEGGNFTAERRRRAVRKLWRTGRRREAAQADDMSHVLPPRPSGALAALRGNPEADVIFGTHSGLGLAAFPREIWHDAPLGRPFISHMWLSPAAEHPSEPEAQVAWIYDWWKRLDNWVEEQGTEPPLTDAGGAPTTRVAP